METFTFRQLREEQIKLSPLLQSNPMYRFMMLTNQMGHLSHAISYMECAKIDPERYSQPEDYRGELKGALADMFSMLTQICFQFDIPLFEVETMALARLEEFNKTRIPRQFYCENNIKEKNNP